MNLLNSSSSLPIYPSVLSSLSVLSSSQANISPFVIFTSPIPPLFPLSTYSFIYPSVHPSVPSTVHPHMPPLSSRSSPFPYIQPHVSPSASFHSPAPPSDNHTSSIHSRPFILSSYLLTFIQPSLYLPMYTFHSLTNHPGTYPSIHPPTNLLIRACLHPFFLPLSHM